MNILIKDNNNSKNEHPNTPKMNIVIKIKKSKK